MSVELIRKEVELREMPKKETVQTVKERDMIVPDGKPDVQHILYLNGEMSIDQIDVQNDRIVYKGQVNVTILYSSNDDQEIYCMQGNIPLEDFIIMEGVDSEHKVEVDYNIEHIHWNILNERKLNVKAIISVTVEAIKRKNAELVVDTTSNEQGKRKVYTQTKTLNVIQLADSGSDSLSVKDELTIMQGMDSVGEMLSMTTTIKEDQIKRTDTEILYNGMVEVKTLYKGQSEEMPLQIATHRIPFAGNVDVMKSDEEIYWDATMEVRPVAIQVAPDFDGEDRVIELECQVDMRYSTYNKETQEVINDVYSPGNKIEMTTGEMCYMTLVGRDSTRVTKKEVMELGTQAPSMDEIVSVQLKPSIDDKEIDGDKLIVKGMMEVKLVYLGGEGMPPIQTAIEMFPFVQELNIPGMSTDDYVILRVIPKDVDVSPYNKEGVMIEYVLDILADVYHEGKMRTIDAIEVVEMSKEEINACPSITVYIVKKGDALWDIAKRFNTTVQDITQINELDVAAPLHQGQKLIVMKKKI